MQPELWQTVDMIDILLHVLGAIAIQAIGMGALVVAHAPAWAAGVIVAIANIAFWFVREALQAWGRITRDGQSHAPANLWRRINHPEWLCVVPVAAIGVIVGAVL